MRSKEGVARFDPTALRRLRAERELTLDQLAERVGTTRPQLIAYEQGRRVPGMDTFAALALTLEVDPLDLTTATEATATLADLRARRGLTKAAFAEKVGLTWTTWDAIERGRQPLRPGLVARAATILEVDEDAIRAAHVRGTAEHAGDRPASSRRHPADVTADRLAGHAEQWDAVLSASERAAMRTTIQALQDIAQGRR
jgi:transcriptional regulator with XRE-family HTH domain